MDRPTKVTRQGIPVNLPAPCELDAWSAVVTYMLGKPSTVLSVNLCDDEHKAHGMTYSVELLIECDGEVRQGYLKTPQEDLYGESLTADIAREVAWRLEGYPWFPGHVRCAAAGRFTENGWVTIEPMSEELWIFEWKQTGFRYADRLLKLPMIGADRACAEARHLCAAMVACHRVMPGNATALYRRALRDALITPIHRLIDSMEAVNVGRRSLRAEVEYACARWRIQLSDHYARLRYVHHDFHPWNVFFEPDAAVVRTIGARLPGFGDPYDDLAAFIVNYLWIGHARSGKVDGPYLAAFDAFRHTFRELSDVGDDAALLNPFLAKRLLVLLNPTYYPTMPPMTGTWLESILRRCLRDELDLLYGDVHRDFAPDLTGVQS